MAIDVPGKAFCNTDTPSDPQQQVQNHDWLVRGQPMRMLELVLDGAALHDDAEHCHRQRSRLKRPSVVRRAWHLNAHDLGHVSSNLCEHANRSNAEGRAPTVCKEIK